MDDDYSDNYWHKRNYILKTDCNPPIWMIMLLMNDQTGSPSEVEKLQMGWEPY